MTHSAEDCVGMCTNRTIKNGMGGSLVSIDNIVNHYKKYEHKGKKDLKALKKQNNMLYIIAKKYGLCRELNNIKKIQAKPSNKCREYSSNSSIDKLDSYSSLA